MGETGTGTDTGIGTDSGTGAGTHTGADADGYAVHIPGLDDIAVVPHQAADADLDAPDAPGAEADDEALSERDLGILDFERLWWKHAGAKERAVRDRFGCSPTRYYQALNALLDRPEALAHDPVLVQRLRRLRDARQRARSTVRRPPRI